DIASAKAWIATIRAKADLHYEIVLGPFRDGDTISAYWRVTATLGNQTAVKVGTDFLKIKDGKITDCWTMNNNAA
ncbi:nuclear transport factor 2 family protein, partial [Neisseria sp. P0012.S006]